MDELSREEVLQAQIHGDPQYKLTSDEIWTVINPLRTEFGIDHLPFVHYKAPPP